MPWAQARYLLDTNNICPLEQSKESTKASLCRTAERSDKGSLIVVFAYKLLVRVAAKVQYPPNKIDNRGYTRPTEKNINDS